MKHSLEIFLAVLVISFIHGCGKCDEDEVTDVDGNVYATITIGDQIWMAENLKVSRYADGTPILNVTDNDEWINLLTRSFDPVTHELTYEITGAYCWYNNDSSAYEKEYGKLYNFGAAESGKLCPLGWHVPSITEWNTLCNPYKIATGNVPGKAGKELMETGTTHWADPLGTNETKFTALPGGIRDYNNFSEIGSKGYYWSSDRGGIAYGAQGLFYPIPFDPLFPDTPLSALKSVTDGLSIRCIKDK